MKMEYSQLSGEDKLRKSDFKFVSGFWIMQEDVLKMKILQKLVQF